MHGITASQTLAVAPEQTQGAGSDVLPHGRAAKKANGNRTGLHHRTICHRKTLSPNKQQVFFIKKTAAQQEATALHKRIADPTPNSRTHLAGTANTIRTRLSTKLETVGHYIPWVLRHIVQTSRHEARSLVLYLLETPGVTLDMALILLENFYGADAMAHARAGLDSYTMGTQAENIDKYLKGDLSHDPSQANPAALRYEARRQSISYLVWFCEQFITQPLTACQASMMHMMAATSSSTAIIPANNQ